MTGCAPLKEIGTSPTGCHSSPEEIGSAVRRTTEPPGDKTRLTPTGVSSDGCRDHLGQGRAQCEACPRTISPFVAENTEDANPTSVVISVHGVASGDDGSSTTPDTHSE